MDRIKSRWVACQLALLICACCLPAWGSTDREPDPLSKYSTSQLLACFANWRICNAADSLPTGWQISDELARRGHIKPLLREYWHEKDPLIRGGIEHVAYHFHTKEVTTFMKKVVAKHMQDDEDLYWPLKYLEEQCDPVALKAFSTGSMEVGCIQYISVVAMFGKCQYRPAIPYLVNSALNDVCGNIIAAAQESLYSMFPGSPKRFSSLEKMQSYYCKRAKQDGFKVHCN